MANDSKGLSSVQAKRKERRINRRSQAMVLVALVIFISVTLLILDLAHEPATSLDAQFSNKLKLNAFRETEQGLEALPSEPLAGDVLVFKVSSSHPLHAAVALSVNESDPVVVFPYARIPPGKDRLVETLDNRYRYRIRETDRRLRFCLLHQADRASLYDQIRVIRDVWAQIREDDCVQVR